LKCEEFGLEPNQKKFYNKFLNQNSRFFQIKKMLEQDQRFFQKLRTEWFLFMAKFPTLQEKKGLNNINNKKFPKFIRFQETKFPNFYHKLQEVPTILKDNFFDLLRDITYS